LFSSFEQKGGLGIQVMLEPISVARIWSCNACGSKIYQGSVTTEPQYQCLCGQRGWRPVKMVMSSTCLKAISGYGR